MTIVTLPVRGGLVPVQLLYCYVHMRSCVEMDSLEVGSTNILTYANWRAVQVERFDILGSYWVMLRVSFSSYRSLRR